MNIVANKSNITFRKSNDVFGKLHNSVICKIQTLLYNMKLSKKLTKAFSFRCLMFYWDDIRQANNLSLCEIKTLSFESFERWLYIYKKLLKNRRVVKICLKVDLSLIS